MDTTIPRGNGHPEKEPREGGEAGHPSPGIGPGVISDIDMGPLLASLRDAFEARWTQAQDRVRERPVSTLAIAAGLGFLVGRWIRA